VRAQLAECVKRVADADFPDAWPALVPSLSAALASPDPPRLTAALLATRALTRKYEFRGRDDADAIDVVVRPLFPRARAVVAAALASPAAAADPAAADAARLALKCLWSATFTGVPRPLVEGGGAELAGWLDCLHAIIAAPPPPGCPPDPDAAAEWPAWKLKKWALHLANRLASRYGDPKLARPGTADAAAAAAWVATGAGDRFLGASLALLSTAATGAAFVSPRCVNLALQHCSHAIPLAAPWRALKPHVPTLIASVCLPAACFDDADAALWVDDPAEYVRRGNDVLAELTCPKHAAVGFVVDACRTRASTALAPTMAALGAVLADLAAAASAGAVPVPLARRADGALLLVGALSGVITRKAAYRASVEPLLRTVVLPLLSPACPHGHLRAKAAWVIAQFADFPFDGAGSGRGPTFDAALAAARAALRDADLPVRVEAAGALRRLIDALHEDGVSAFQAALPDLLATLLGVMAELDSEELVSALDAAVEKVGPGVAPYAAALASQLVAAHDRMVASAATEGAGGGGGGGGGGSLDDDDDDAAIAACAVLRALVTVVDAVADVPGALASVEPVVAPLAARLLADEDGHDSVDEALDLVSYLTYFGGGGAHPGAAATTPPSPPPPISPTVWALYDPLTDALGGWAADYFGDGLPALANYVTRDPAAFLAPPPSPSAPSRLDRALALATRCLSDGDAGDDEVLPAPRLLAVILAACRGRADGAVGATVGAILDRLAAGVPAHDELRDALLSALGAAFYYSPALAAGALAARGAADAAFTHWLALASARTKAGKPKFFKAASDKKVCVLGLAAAAATPPGGGLPASLDADRTPLLAAALPLLHAWAAQKAAADAAAAASSRDDEGGRAWPPSDDDGDADADADSDDGDAAGYVRRLAAAAARRAARGGDDDDDGESDSDGGSFWSDEGAAEIDTPLDAVDPAAVVAAAAGEAAAAGRLAGVAGDPGLRNAIAAAVAAAGAVKRAEA
jgi:hypothetical protein